MRRFIKLFSAIAILMVTMCTATSCRNALKYADDAWKAIDDKIDDWLRHRHPKPITLKTCDQCNGNGHIYNIYDGRLYECSKCGGTGKVILN